MFRLTNDIEEPFSQLEDLANLSEVAIAETSEPNIGSIAKEVYEGKRSLELRLCYGIPKSDKPEPNPDAEPSLKMSQYFKLSKELGFSKEQAEEALKKAELEPNSEVSRYNKELGSYISAGYSTDGLPECYYLEFIELKNNGQILPPLLLKFFKGQEKEARAYLKLAAEPFENQGIKITTRDLS